MVEEKKPNMIENIQRRATKLIPGLSDLSYENRLRRLKLPSLSYRRSRGDMIEVHYYRSSRRSNVYNVLAVTTFSERLFHILTTRIQNEFFLMFSLHLGLNNLYLCPLVLRFSCSNPRHLGTWTFRY
jgi:hypothetical protein